MSEQCQIDELRTLFLFEHLGDAQLETLCAEGRVETLPAGPLFNEGDPATCFYVLIDGELVMSGRTAGVDVQTHRTTQRGAYCGAWSAYVPNAEQTYTVSVRLVRPSRFFVLDAEKFARFMQTEFPMAVHLLAGHTLGSLRQQQILGQRARLLGLGTITAGLTHQLNNPAAAISRAVAGLWDSGAKLQRKLAMFTEGGFTADSVRALVIIQDDVTEHVRTSPGHELSALESADREERLSAWFDDHGITHGWDYAPTFVDAGLGVNWLDRLSRSVGAGHLAGAVEWLKHTIDTQLHTREIAEASRRISALLADAKQYSQMDRGDYRYVNLHELLRSTLMVFNTSVGADGPIELITEWDSELPEILCYAGDLNQVWTNIIENAVEAMAGQGTLTIRTGYECENMVRVEIIDDGPGIDDDIIDRIFTPFFSTKPVGEGTGLGLDLAWRIVEKHAGSVSVQSKPGDTRFIVCLPLEAPGPENAAAEVPVVRPTSA